MEPNFQRKKILALITGAISVLIGVIYLVLIILLDFRGPILPPPSEAFGEMGVVYTYFFSMVQQLFLKLYQ